VKRELDRQRPSAARRGYGPRWRRARAAYLARHPLCVPCAAAGRLAPATVVDHVVPHRGDPVLFWDERNWQGLCKPCHGRQDRARGPLGRTTAELTDPSPPGGRINLYEMAGRDRAVACVWPRNSAGGYPGAKRQNP
jgi:5-methylcytosine-specific restriction endonuclease McrA